MKNHEKQYGTSLRQDTCIWAELIRRYFQHRLIQQHRPESVFH